MSLILPTGVKKSSASAVWAKQERGGTFSLCKYKLQAKKKSDFSTNMYTNRPTQSFKEKTFAAKVRHTHAAVNSNVYFLSSSLFSSGLLNRTMKGLKLACFLTAKEKKIC